MAQIELQVYIAGVSDNGDGTFTVKQETRTKSGKKVYEHESRFVACRDENVTRISANGEGMTSKLPGDWTARILGDAEVAE